MTDRIVLLTLTRIEAQHLADLALQFVELLDEPESSDPAIERITPAAYTDDLEASRDFRRATRGDLLRRRSQDAHIVLRDLESVEDPSGTDDLAPVDVPLEGESVDAWLRTLTALRLVIASRLGISHEDDHDADDPRFGVYDWLGFRLEGLIQVTDP